MTGSTAPRSWAEFWDTPVRMRVYLTLVCVAALVLPFLALGLGPDETSAPEWLTVTVLVAVSALNVEISRILAGGLSRTQQPHKALSAWAFASALLLPTPWLLVVIPVTYAHARVRGLHVPLWKWIGSAAYLVLCGLAAALVRHVVMGEESNWMRGDGGRGLLAMALAAIAFLALEALLFAGSVTFNRAEDEVWLRRTLTSSSFYLTESAVLIMGGFLAAVWTGGAWFVLLFLPLYAIIQRAALLEPLRERAEAAALLAEKNHELELANQFKADLMGMLGHEIGNPLTAIQGYAALGADALGRGDTSAGREALEVVERNGVAIRRVVHEILTLVSSEQGTLTAYPEPCELEPHLRAAAAALPPQGQPEIACPDGLTALVQPGHLDQILANLLSNAAKHAGGATQLVAGPTADGQIEIAVCDGGPGISEALRDKLFQRFSRDSDAGQKVAGTGLGLFISRELARANGGDVVHRDATPCGTTFVVTLPVVEAEALS